MLDTVQVRGLDPTQVVPLLIFAFALSVDYEVFLISRIAERVERDREAATGDARADAERLNRVTDIAVREGLQNTGRIITSAALLMIVVFAGFAFGEMSGAEQTGFAMGIAIFIDATIVRLLLVPATMTLMGGWNWWAPSRSNSCTTGSGCTSTG